MQATTTSFALRHAGAKPPPLWFVTNGEVTVGPVTTNLLVRGVLHERVPHDCMVRERTWSGWRSLERIREVAALRRIQARQADVQIEQARWRDAPVSPAPFEALEAALLGARDPGEVLVECLMEVMRSTGACVGAVYRRGAPNVGFVTACVQGPGMARRVGRAVHADDPVAALALGGETLCEEPRPGAASGIVQVRLGAFPACSGVAMAPIACAGRLYAMLEVGRPDHAFREADFRRILGVAGLAEERLGIVRNASQISGATS